MAITFNDNRLILNEADAITGYTATDGPTLFTSAPSPIESTGLLGMNVSNTNENAYFTITSDDYSGGGSLTVWVTNRASLATTAAGGIGIVVGDGTNRVAYHVGGSDGTAFRHDQGPVNFACFLLDLANKPANFTTLAGSEASLNEAAITQVGLYFTTIAKSVGGVENCFWDIIRWADNGVGIEIYGGTVGTPESWTTIALTDRSTGNQQAYGVIRRVGVGVYDIQGNISIGDATGTNDTYINSVGEVFIFGDRGQSANNYYRFNCAGNGTGTTDVNFDGATFNNALDGSMDFSDPNITGDIRNSVLSGWTQGINTGGSGNVWSGNSYSNCGTLTTTGTDIRNSVFTNFPGVADDSQLFWNSTSDPDGSIDGSSFTKGTNATHAIEFPTGMTNTSITIRNCDFSGYNASNGQNDSTFNVLATTGTLTINIVGGSGNVSYKSAGATVVVQQSVGITITVSDQTGSPIQNAQTAVYLTSDRTEVINTDTNASGVASGSFSGTTPSQCEVRVRKASSGDTKYRNFSSIQTITSNGLDFAVTLAVDPNNNATT